MHITLALARASSLLILTTALAACSSAGTTGASGNDDGRSADDGGSSGSSGSSGGGSSGSTDSPSVYSTEVKDGIATFYAATGAGNCSFDPTPDDLDVVALNFPEYATSAACGACMKVTGSKGSVVVRVVDSCPECEEHHLDLSREAFAKIADPKDGRVPITYQTVSCQTSSNVQYLYKTGSSQWWTAIQIRNHRLPITKLEYKKGAEWVAIERLDYNYFVVQDGVGKRDGLPVRITGGSGQVLEDIIPGGIVPDEIVQGSVQFE